VRVVQTGKAATRKLKGDHARFFAILINFPWQYIPGVV
jgi:hypothetical protein